MPAGLRIPTVTQVDLQAFQARCFDRTLTGIAPDDNAVQASSEDKDGLRYYSDGAKRILTNEQIAMFRHSEIQTLLRERRHKMENRDASEHSSAELEDIGEEAVQNPILEGDEEEEYARFLEREQEQIRPETVTKKRKRSYKAEERWDEPDRGDRWIARELDGAIVQHEDLDYGDDAATESLDQDGFNEQRMQLERGRRRTVYEDDDNAGAVTSVAGDRRVEIPLQKKSFLWPSVGI